MGHGIKTTDNLFSVREIPWHGLGTVFEEYPTAEEARQAAHPWEPISEPVFAKEPCFTPYGDLETDYIEIEGFKALRRSDNGHTLGVVPNSYTVIQNQTLYDIAETLEGESKGAVRFETGGSLLGGRRVWLMVRLREPLIIRGDNETATVPYFVMQNAHDGSASFRGQAVNMRVVCMNTARAADAEAKRRGTEFTFRHTVKVAERIEEARGALEGWRESVEEYRQFSEHMAQMEVSPDQERAFVEKFMPLPPAGTTTDRVIENVLASRGEWEKVYASQTNEQVAGTRYGLIQASVEYLQHSRRAHTSETRFRRSFLDPQRLLRDASEIAQAV